MLPALLLAPLLALCTGAAWGARTYLQPQAFLASVFHQAVPASQTLWLTGNLQSTLSKVLGHPPATVRVSYWQQGDRSAWILNEIGKVAPITAGFVVQQGKIERTRVLIFREDRGWEIKNPNFTRQFAGASLNADGRLSQHIDGISGATLSVNAMRKMARMALVLGAKVEHSSSAE